MHPAIACAGPGGRPRSGAARGPEHGRRRGGGGRAAATLMALQALGVPQGSQIFAVLRSPLASLSSLAAALPLSPCLQVCSARSNLRSGEVSQLAFPRFRVLEFLRRLCFCALCFLRVARAEVRYGGCLLVVRGRPGRGCWISVGFVCSFCAVSVCFSLFSVVIWKWRLRVWRVFAVVVCGGIRV